MRKLAPAALTAAAALLLLTGCSAGGQSVADACAIAEEKVTAAQSDLQEAMSSAQSGDADAATDLIDGFSTALDEAEAEITNEEVKPVIAKLGDQFAQVGGAIEEIAGIDTTDPENVDKLTTISDEMMTVSQDLQTTGAELDELCNA